MNGIIPDSNLDITKESSDELNDFFVTIHNIDIIPEDADFDLSEPFKFRYKYLLCKTNITYDYYYVIYAWGDIKSKKNTWKWMSYKIDKTEKENYVKIIKICHLQTQELMGYNVLLPDGSIHYSSFHYTIRQIQTRTEVKDASSLFSAIVSFQVGENKIREDIETISVKWFEEHNSSITSYISRALKEISFLQEIKIVEPYLSIQLIDLLQNSLLKQSKIKIITTRLSDNRTEPIFMLEIENKLKEHEIEIKYISKDPSPQDIKSRPPSNPFHDRYFLGRNSGLIVGTSVNSIIKNSTFVVKIQHGKDIYDHFDLWFSGAVQSYNSRNIKCERWYKHG